MEILSGGQLGILRANEGFKKEKQTEAARSVNVEFGDHMRVMFWTLASFIFGAAIKPYWKEAADVVAEAPKFRMTGRCSECSVSGRVNDTLLKGEQAELHAFSFRYVRAYPPQRELHSSGTG